MAKQKKISKASKRRLMIFGTISCFIMLFCLVNLITYSYKIKKLSDEEANLTIKLKELKDEELDLKNEVTKLKDPEYLARYARENYLYTKDGEYVIKVDENKTKKQNIKTSNIINEYKIYIIITALLLLFTIIYILKTLKSSSKSKK